LSDDTFGLLLPDTTTAGSSLAARVEELAGGVFGPIDITLQVRVGLARCPLDGVTADDLLEKARTRLDGKELVAP
jgi:hypothetical protein